MPRFKFYITILSFFIFLFPFSVAIGNDGLSANYTFLLLPMILIYKKNIKSPNPKYLLIIFFYFFIFIVSSIYQYELFNLLPRRTISFLIFMVIFSFLFVKMDENLIYCFKISIVLIAIYFSLTTLMKFIYLGGNEIGFAGKGEVGSQRFGFIYTMALWILFFYKSDSFRKSLFMYLLILLIALGLLLTFSRSGIVAMILTFMLFALGNLFKWLKKPSIGGIKNFTIFIIITVSSIIILYINFPLLFNFFETRLFSFFIGGGQQSVDVSNEDTSEGYRIYMLKKVFTYILSNPITGSGFLGVWVLFEDQSGSAHNQYLDILFRTGIVGFFIYIYLIYLILKIFRQLDRGLYWGFLSIIVYGFFHETFKLSQGSFVFSFMLGVVGCSKFLLKKNEK